MESKNKGDLVVIKTCSEFAVLNTVLPSITCLYMIKVLVIISVSAVRAPYQNLQYRPELLEMMKVGLSLFLLLSIDRSKDGIYRAAFGC